MGMLVAIEGGDGAGKATAAAEVARQLHEAGRAATVLSFPRYGATVGGWALGEFLGNRLPRSVSPRAAATLYALDRLESRDVLLAAAAAHEVVVLDRYVASNMAYQAAQVDAADGPGLMAWIARLEVEQFALPAPTLSVYLDTPLAVARRMIAQKHRRTYTDETFDQYEADASLQARVRANYAAMAAGGLLGRWETVATVRGEALRPVADIAREIVGYLAPPVPDRDGSAG